MSSPKRRIRIQLVAADPQKDPTGEALAKTERDVRVAVKSEGLTPTADESTASDPIMKTDAVDLDETSEDSALRVRIEDRVGPALEAIIVSAGDATKAARIAASMAADCFETTNRELELLKSEVITTAVRGFIELKSRVNGVVQTEYAKVYESRDTVYIGVFLLALGKLAGG